MALVKRYLSSLAFWMLVAYCVGAATFGYLYARVQNQANENRNALLALCAFKEDLDRRIMTGEEFLKRNPDGLPAVGISAADLQQSINNQTRTRDTLKPHLMDCPEV